MSSRVAHNLSSQPRTEDVILTEENKTDFKSMILPPLIIDGLTKAGFVQPSPIQLKAIPLARCGFDLIVQSKSGTGKTCVFTVAALDSLNIDSKRLQTLVLAPTREIANQIKFVVEAIGSQFPGLSVVPLIGGLPLQKDRERLMEGCHIVVGTPGRVRHCIELGLIELSAVRLFVLDEADMLMTPSFKDDINAIFENLPSSKQVLVCSATYTSDLVTFLGNYMHNPTYVTPSGGQCSVLLGLRHFVFISTDESSNQLRKLASKENQLMSILKSVPFSQCLVFSNYQTRAESICQKLRRKGWKNCCEWIAGSQNQSTRIEVYDRVRDFKARILLTTDLTARGVDFEAVNLVINLDIPSDPHTYLHRMGRAGRFGGQGIVITLLTTDEIPKFRKLIGRIGSHANAHIIPDNLLSKELWAAKLDELEIVEGDFESKELETKDSPMSEAENDVEINPGNENDDNDEEDCEDIKTTELLEFGLKLLRLRKAPEFCPFKKLEESRQNFVDDVANDKDMNKWRKVLEPPGSLDSDVAEYFISSFSQKSADVTKMCRKTTFVDAIKGLPTRSDIDEKTFKYPKRRDSTIDDLNLDKLEISAGCSNETGASHSDGHRADVIDRLVSSKSESSNSPSSSRSSSPHSSEEITGETSNPLLDADTKSIQHSSRQNKMKKPVHIFVPNRKSREPSSYFTSHHRENRDSMHKNESNVPLTNSPPKRKLCQPNSSSTSSEHHQENYHSRYNDESNVQSFDYSPQQVVRKTRTPRKRMRQATESVQMNDPRIYSSHHNNNRHHRTVSSLDQWNSLYHQQLSQIRMFTNYSYYINQMLHSQNHRK